MLLTLHSPHCALGMIHFVQYIVPLNKSNCETVEEISETSWLHYSHSQTKKSNYGKDNLMKLQHLP